MRKLKLYLSINGIVEDIPEQKDISSYGVDAGGNYVFYKGETIVEEELRYIVPKESLFMIAVTGK